MSRVPLAGLGHLVGRFDVDGDVGTGRFWITMEPEPPQPWPDSSGTCAERAVNGRKEGASPEGLRSTRPLPLGGQSLGVCPGALGGA